MSRLTVTLPDELHRALKASAAARGATIGEQVAERIVAYGLKAREEAESLVARARARAGLSGERALALATRETRAARR